MITATIRIDKEHLERMKKIKNETGVPMSIQIKKALDKYFGE